MNKVLIVTEVFPPAFNPRMGYLVKYLCDFGWKADVITNNTTKENNYKCLVGDGNIVRVDLHNRDTPGGISQKIWRFINLKRHFRNNSKPFIKGIRENFRKEDYSLILISVSHDLFVLEAGTIIAKRWNLPVIADLRDIKEQKPKNDIPHSFKGKIIQCYFNSFEKSKIKLRNRLLSKVQAVSTISQFHVSQLSRYNRNIRLIYNGYDSDLFHPDIVRKADKFYIIYTGIVLGKTEQDPGLLFEAVHKLDKEGTINTGNFRIQFYTPFQYRSAIQEHDLYSKIRAYIDFYDFVDFQKVPEVLSRASIALILANRASNNGPNGILTTKFFDYLGAERPVLCVRSDESLLEEAIEKSGVGISARNIQQAYEFILALWKDWSLNGYTKIEVDRSYKESFTRKSQAKQFVDLFHSLTDK